MTIVTITNEDLFTNTYGLDVLKNNIYAVSLRNILKTQILTADFCAKYILNPNFQLLPDDETLTLDDVLRLQPHILDKDLINSLVNVEKKRRNREKIGSFDFEMISNTLL